ncbi:MAG: DegT/DnrJ/EryC1/StrS family aminotransferase [Methyloceanibacter sp.]
MSKDGTVSIPAFIDLAAQRRQMGDRAGKALIAVLESGQYVLGPQVTEIERQLTAFTGAKHCISCANGTDALLLALMAERVGVGDAVFVPAFTFVATAEVVVLQGATPVFVDVRRDTFNMDPESLDAAIGEAKKRGFKPRAIVAVDLFGQPADYARIHEIAAAHDLVVIDDAAQSFGATLDCKKVGTLAAYSATSFYPSKPLGAYGDGGAIFTDDDVKAELLLSLRNHGKGPDQKETEEIGLNSRLDSFQAAVLLEKLKLFPAEIKARQASAERYGVKLRAVAKVPELMAGASSVWAQYTIVTERRDELAKACREAGVPTAVHYAQTLHQLAPYRDYPTAPGGLPQSEWLTDRVISLPMHGYLSEEVQDFVIDTVLDALRSGASSVAAE